MPADEGPPDEPTGIDVTTEEAPMVLVCVECKHTLPMEEERPMVGLCLLCGGEMYPKRVIDAVIADASVDSPTTTQTGLDEF